MKFINRVGFSLIDFFRKTNTLPIYDKLIESQWYSKENLLEKQFLNLKNLLCAFIQKRSNL